MARSRSKIAAPRATVLILAVACCLLACSSHRSSVDSVSTSVPLALVARTDGAVDSRLAQIKERMERRKLEKAARPEDPIRRARERLQDRGFEDGIPFDLLAKAMAHTKKMPLKEDGPLTDGGIKPWEWLGPGNVGGRARTLVFHPDDPQIMWLGTSQGGIWKTEDGGSNWLPLDDFLPSLCVSTLAIDPRDPDVLYAGTGESFSGSGGVISAGVLRSSDAGRTWTQLPETTNWRETNRLNFNPFEPTQLFAATQRGIFQSSDGGDEWTERSSVRVKDLKFSPDQSGRAVAGGINGNALWSDDGGVTWQEAQFEIPLSTTLISEDFQRDEDDDDDLIRVRSTEGLARGDLIRIGLGRPPFGEMTVVRKVVDGETLKVQDLELSYGAFCCAVENLPNGRVELAWGSNCTVYASMNAGGGAVFRSDDCGETFGLMATTDTIPRYLCSNFFGFVDPNAVQGNHDNAIWVAPDDNDLVVVGGIDLYRSRDDDGTFLLDKISNWFLFHLGTSAHADQHTIIHHPDYDGDQNKIVFVTNDGGIQRANDIKSPGLGDFGWANLANNLGAIQFYAGAAAPRRDGGDYIIGGAQDNGNLKFDEPVGPQGWFQCLACTGDGGFAAIDYNCTNIVYATTQNLTVSKSFDFGTTHLPATNGLTDHEEKKTRFIAPMILDPNNPGILVAGGESIWRTVDATGVWNSIRSPIASNSRCSAIDIAYRASGRIWVGYEDGTISRSTNVRDFVDVDENAAIPDATVTDIAVNPCNAKEVFVAVGGFRSDNLWFTDDNGQTWVKRTGTPPNDLPAIQINTVTFHPADPNKVYVGTDLGVFASDDKGLHWNVNPLNRGVEHDGPAHVEVDDLFWQDGEYLLAATYGRGMFRTHPFPVLYVDERFQGEERGKRHDPFNTVTEAVNATRSGDIVVILPGQYRESPVIYNRPCKLTAPCGNVRIR